MKAEFKGRVWRSEVTSASLRVRSDLRPRTSSPPKTPPRAALGCLALCLSLTLFSSSAEAQSSLNELQSAIVHQLVKGQLQQAVEEPIEGSIRKIDYRVSAELDSVVFDHEGGRIPVLCDGVPCDSYIAMDGFDLTLREGVSFVANIGAWADGWFIPTIDVDSTYRQSLEVVVTVPVVNQTGTLVPDLTKATVEFPEDSLSGNATVSGLGGEIVVLSNWTAIILFQGFTIDPLVSWLVTSIVINQKVKPALENAVETMATNALLAAADTLPTQLALAAPTLTPILQAFLTGLIMTVVS